MIQRIAPNEKITISDRDIKLDPNYLNGLNEAERGEVTFRLRRGEQLISEGIHEIRVLACDEWGGIGTMGELLAAFVMPNDPALANVLKMASEVMAMHGHSTALENNLYNSQATGPI